ncbi:hypothetical protein B1B04_20450 [Lysinibacillus sp. KCTC 33748]|uniref:hypothetical protein n=1 Tax=unclassified Lysinibacillus TaxID=2636778 RepID=UPI0009A5CB0D|nr:MULTISPECIES: hypothetical protein [unclassified Lysinibacillus]OXS68499.1 hypothetical protein B1B04_20450 [Lysinibacillus sp. KCTC 33748]SKC10314.1 hypothetical protein SAMN06295926_12323 [Lysinibacillus sp. AC-3]
MQENQRFALIASLFALIGLPTIFLTISLYTGVWRFFIISIAPALTVGLTGLILTMQKIKKDKRLA